MLMDLGNYFLEFKLPKVSSMFFLHAFCATPSASEQPERRKRWACMQLAPGLKKTPGSRCTWHLCPSSPIMPALVMLPVVQEAAGFTRSPTHLTRSFRSALGCEVCSGGPCSLGPRCAKLLDHTLLQQQCFWTGRYLARFSAGLG